jgi:hypothetical protein
MAQTAAPPPLDAFHVEWVIDPFTLTKTIGMVRHPGRPAVFDVRPQDQPIDDAFAQQIGRAYLEALANTLGYQPGNPEWIDANVWKALETQRNSGEVRFGWLGVKWGVTNHKPESADRKGLLGSFWVDRRNGAENVAAPRLLVLLAGVVAEENSLQTGSDMGLRIVLHVHRGEVRIYGMTMAGLSHDRALKTVPQVPFQDKSLSSFVVRVKDVVSAALQNDGPLWIDNLEVTRTQKPGANRLTASGFALRSRKRLGTSEPVGVVNLKTGQVASPQTSKVPNRARAYDFKVDVEVNPVSGQVQVVAVHRDAYVGSGARTRQMTRAKQLRAFVQDAASSSNRPDRKLLSERRPTLSDEVLDEFRDDVSVELMGDAALRFGDGASDWFETRSASRRSADAQGGTTVGLTDRRVVRLLPLASPKTGEPTGPGLRSDQQASVETHLRAAELFERMRGYGVDPHAYFRFARLPLVQRARPAMRWAPDGELPNAEVRPFMGDPDADGSGGRTWASERLQLLVKYGSADPMNRRTLPLAPLDDVDNSHRRKAQYLSIASDPRWAWHEFGHVLNFASTGELEFPFAHSAGDALAAIAADPMSRLAMGDDPEAKIRHVTFPWIEVPGRSHGRSATRGYGWCGCRNLVRLDFTSTLERYHHSYFGEQLLSSSLFRLYRSLGGDTRGQEATHGADEATRLSASDYCIYLIMRAISLLGPDTLAPARTPDQFVSALIEADLGTAAWDVVDAVWPFNRDKRTMHRRGGRVHKVIRWAFEQQGLYATRDPKATVDALGLPPAVDVFIADRSRPDGGYAPIPLRATAGEAWQADTDWVRRKGQTITIKLANRGSERAQDVGIRVWWGSLATNGESIGWNEVSPSTETCSIDTNSSTEVGLKLPAEAGQGPLWFLISADAPADPSNLCLPVKSPMQWDDLMELVAHDNNLALALG